MVGLRKRIDSLVGATSAANGIQMLSQPFAAEAAPTIFFWRQ